MCFQDTVQPVELENLKRVFKWPGAWTKVPQTAKRLLSRRTRGGGLLREGCVFKAKSSAANPWLSGLSLAELTRRKSPRCQFFMGKSKSLWRTLHIILLLKRWEPNRQPSFDNRQLPLSRLDTKKDDKICWQDPPAKS